MHQILTRALGLVLAAALALACQTGTTVPTSSDATVTATETLAKGGTVACAGALSVTLDPATGNVTQLTCQANGAWTDPPTAEETNALARFGDALLGVIQMPFAVIAAFGRAMNPVPVP